MFLILPFCSKAEEFSVIKLNANNVIELNERPPFEKLRKLRVKLSKVKHNKLTAVGLALVLGPFGVHRLYLGTSTKVPVIYSVTFGGFFILPLIDIGVILFTKNFERLKGDERVIMWAPKKEKSQTE